MPRRLTVEVGVASRDRGHDGHGDIGALVLREDALEAAVLDRLQCVVE